MTEHLPQPPLYRAALEPWRHHRAEYLRDHFNSPSVWYQDGRRLRHVKTSKAFIWPKDGRNGSKLGRMRDILKGRGPDIFVAFGARSGDCVSNRPSRSQWSKHVDLDEDQGTLDRPFNSAKLAPWTEGGILSGGRTRNMAYDFRTRKYMKRHPGMWTDAIWQPDPYESGKWNAFPEALRTTNGQWWQDYQHLPAFLGGPPTNEFGTGPDFF
ncbi:hypothetical protein G6011_10350 [Alternaria panax]|uniref:Uncharacterized protein n=1 Tax=Alternaria panax TaxID=48097 RepID=A0AAD4NN20_9PLEO|nr:hypothetical protein G6011_10350 [Alternaria panax]